MSYVYTVTIQISYDKKEEARTKLNDWLKANNHLGGSFEYMQKGNSAGTKCPERELCWGGLNYLNIEEFIELFKSLNLEDSILTIASPEHGHYTIIAGKDTVVEVK